MSRAEGVRWHKRQREYYPHRTIWQATDARGEVFEVHERDDGAFDVRIPRASDSRLLGIGYATLGGAQRFAEGLMVDKADT